MSPTIAWRPSSASATFITVRSACVPGALNLFESATTISVPWRRPAAQALQLHTLAGDQAREDFATGDLVLEGRTGETSSGDGVRLWAGRIADSFYIDLSLLAIINGAVANGTAPDLSGWRPDKAQNSFAGTLVESIVLEVSHQHPQMRPGALTGVWCATMLATDAGGWRQINRAGHPMMWPIFWPNDTDSPPQRADNGRQCPRGNAVPGHQHRRALRDSSRPSPARQRSSTFPYIVPA